MAGATAQKKVSSGRGSLLALLVLFADSAVAAELSQMVRWNRWCFVPTVIRRIYVNIVPTKNTCNDTQARTV